MQLFCVKSALFACKDITQKPLRGMRTRVRGRTPCMRPRLTQSFAGETLLHVRKSHADLNRNMERGVVDEEQYVRRSKENPGRAV